MITTDDSVQVTLHGEYLAKPLSCFAQHQNSNFTEEFSALMADVEPGIPWAQGEKQRPTSGFSL